VWQYQREANLSQPDHAGLPSGLRTRSRPLRLPFRLLRALRFKQKTSRWHAPSKGLASRVKRQDAHEEADRRLGKVDRATLETSQAALERKARIYDELKRGGTGGLSERQLKEAAVDVRPTVAPRLSSLAG
jgi:hypothetical protein